MKLIISILTMFLGGPLPEDTIYVSNQTSFETTIYNLNPGKDVWIVCPLSDSVENRILLDMSKDPDWENKITIERGATFKEYRELIKNAGLTIKHTEIQRKFIKSVPFDWVRELGLEPSEEVQFEKSFMKRFQQSDHLAKRMLIHVFNPQAP